LIDEVGCGDGAARGRGELQLLNLESGCRKIGLELTILSPQKGAF
jgi:hypothetical protein